METNGAKISDGQVPSNAASKWGGWGSFAAKSRALFIILLALAVLPALFAISQTQSALEAEEKANGAHHILELYIELSEVGHAVEKQLAIAGSLDNPIGRKLLSRKNVIALEMRKGIAAEIGMRGAGGMAEEGEELDHVDKTISTINAMVAGAANTGWHMLVDEAIQHEREEISEIDNDEKFALKSTIVVLGASVGIVLVFYGLALFWLDRSISTPLTRLRHATNRVAEGVRQVRLPKMRDNEFKVLADNFNRMAEALDTRRDQLESDASLLESQVAARTSALNLANAKLIDIAENRTKFLTDISHELRTPLAIIRGDAEVTLRGEEKPLGEYQSALSRIAAQISGLTRLVDDLLYVARNESGAPSLKMRPIELVSLINKAVKSMLPMIEDVDGHMAFSSDMEAERIVGDDQRLTQLTLILLDNAVQYSDGAPDITIELLHAPDGCMLQVRDRGLGIAANDLPNVFDRFRRGREGAVKNDNGLGIGLPMAKSIAEAHGGSISIASNLGEGTTVSVFLPAAQKLKVVNEHIGS